MALSWLEGIRHGRDFSSGCDERQIENRIPAYNLKMGKGIFVGVAILAFSLSAQALPGCTGDRCARGLRGDVTSVETVSLARDSTVRQRLEFDARGELTRSQRAEGRSTTVTQYRRTDAGLLEVAHHQGDRLVLLEQFDSPIESTLLDAAQRVTERCQYTRDSLNRVTRRTCTGDGLIHTESLEYDDAGFLERRRLSAMVGQFGMQTEAVYEGGAEKTWSVAFVAPGNDRRAMFTYRYDKTDPFGNWLERSRLDERGVAVESETREIRYASPLAQ
jgi:hypothetical protein